MDAGIGVLSNEATRSARKYLLDCVTNGAAQFGCPVTVFARASTCTRDKIRLSSKDVACLIIVDGALHNKTESRS